METATHGEVLARFGAALSDPTRSRVLLALRDAPAYPADLADLLGVSRQSLSNHLTCLRGCGLVVAVPEGRRTRYELADDRLRHALTDLLGVVLAVDEQFCQDTDQHSARVPLMAIDLPALAVPVLAAERARRAVLTRRIRWFVAATITYNLIEAVVAITAGSIASSSALIGFGLDSVIEVASAAAIAWQFTAKDPETREKTALRIIAFSFFGLAAYVTVDAVRALFGVGEATPSTVGLILAAFSLVIMPFLSYGQRRAGRELGSRSAVADSKQTLLCTYLSGVLLVGLGLNSALGWSWADPIAALVIAAVAVKEGREAWNGDACCAPAFPADPGSDPAIHAFRARLQSRRDADSRPIARCTDGCCAPTANGGYVR